VPLTIRPDNPRAKPLLRDAVEAAQEPDNGPDKGDG
jgi:hypothetical protein